MARNGSVGDCINSNSTLEVAYREVIICGAFSGLFAVFGLFTNTISLLVYSDRRLRRAPINWYFATLSLSDFFLCLTSILLFSVRPVAVFLDDIAWTRISRYITKELYPFSLMCQTSSVWLTVSVAVYRFLGICFPLKTLHVTTPAYVQRNIFGVISFAVIYNIPRFFEIVTESCWHTQWNDVSADLKQTKLRSNPTYRIAYVVASYNIVMFAIPVGLLIGVNIAIIRALRSSVNFKRATYASLKLSSTEFRSTRKPCNTGIRRANTNMESQSSDRSVSVMLVILVFFFLFCNIIPLLCNLLEIPVTSLASEDTENQLFLVLEHVYFVMVDLGNMMATVNSSMNIIIYYMYGQHFKAVLDKYCKEYLRCSKETPKFERVPTMDMLISSRSSMKRPTGTIVDGTV